MPGSMIRRDCLINQGGLKMIRRENFNERNRVVRRDKVTYEGDKYFVSTVDLGINHQLGSGPPLWYETMIFAMDENDNIDWIEMYCNRYTTREEAKEGHKKVMDAFKNNKIEIHEHE